MKHSPYTRTFKKFPVQDKVSETFIVHEKIWEILLMYNKVSAQDKVAATFPGQETLPDYQDISDTAGLRGRPVENRGDTGKYKDLLVVF